MSDYAKCHENKIREKNCTCLGDKHIQDIL